MPASIRSPPPISARRLRHPPGSPVSSRGHDDLTDLPDRTRPQVGARRHEARHEVHVLGHHEHDAGRAGGREDRVRLGQGPRDRLLEEDALAVLGGQAGVRLVQVVGRADDERVDARVGGRGLVGAEGRESAEAPSVRLRARGISARERDPHRAAELPGGTSVKDREPAAPDDGEPERAPVR